MSEEIKRRPDCIGHSALAPDSSPHGGDIYTHQNAVLDFSVNTNPLGPPARVLEAAKRGVDLSVHYPDVRCRKLKKALAAKLSEENLSGLSGAEDMLIIGNGAADLLYTYVFAARPKCVLLAVPCFSEYEKALHAADCTIRYLYLKEEENFRITEAILDCLTADVDLCILCSPSNPAGQVIEKDLLGRIVKRCTENQIRLVLDESFRFFSFPAKSSAETSFLCPPAVSRKDEKDNFPGNLFLLRSFTKIYAIPGLRLGYGICADRTVIDKMEASRQDWSVSVPAQEAGLAALGEKDHTAYIRRTRELIRTERERLERAFSAIGLSYIPSEANFILLKSDADLYHALLNIGILIRDCANYRGLGKGWYRVSVRTEAENTVLIQAMKEILQP